MSRFVGPGTSGYVPHSWSYKGRRTMNLGFTPKQFRKWNRGTSLPKKMDRAITKRAEKKHNHIQITENADIDEEGAFVKLSAIGGGTDNHDRLGSYCTPISLKMQFAMQPGTPNFVIVRMMIFAYYENDDTPNEPLITDVLENTTGDNALYSPYRQANNNTRVLWDRLGYVCGLTGSNFKVITGKVLIPKSKMKVLKFNRAGVTDGTNMLYLLLISSRLGIDPGTEKPTFSAVSNLRFTDT